RVVPLLASVEENLPSPCCSTAAAVIGAIGAAALAVAEDLLGGILF
ncbi:hypothetical protein Tco_0661639, partial [Tanacetum coccineum]